MDASTGQAPGRIFISYRREETAYPAGWLYDRLADRFGAGQVFKDVDSIRLGDDFVEVITRAVGSCDELLALIGDQWLTVSDERGRRRLEDPDDFVLLEIEAALTRQVRVIPILIDGARMPHAEDLPDSQRRRAPARGWVLAGVGAGVALILLIAALVANSARAPAPTAPAGRQDAAAASGGIHADPTPVTNGDGIRLTGLEATSRTDPPAVGDTVTVRYSLTNVGDLPVQLASTFVGARNAADDNQDAEGTGAGRTLASGETVQTQARVVLDGAGVWQLWPCYELADGRTCPDEWQAFSVVAR